MCLGQIGLQLQSPLGQGARFFAVIRCGLVCAQHPAFQLRVAREGESKVWIQLNGALIKLLALF